MMSVDETIGLWNRLFKVCWITCTGYSWFSSFIQYVWFEFQIEIRELKDRLAVEKASWEENYMKKQETWMLQKERELKDQVRRDRDKEIELVISRLEEDATASREETEKAAEHKIRFVLSFVVSFHMNYYAMGIPYNIEEEVQITFKNYMYIISISVVLYDSFVASYSSC